MKKQISAMLALIILITMIPKTWARSPGAAIVMTGVPGSSAAVPADAAVLWRTPEFILTAPGELPAGKLLTAPDENKDLYLVRVTDPAEMDRISAVGALIPASKDWYLLELPAGDTAPGILPEESVFLGYPATSAQTLTPPPSIGPIAWDAQVQTLVDAVSESQLMADLTTLVDFQTRFSYADQCRQAGAWLGQQYEALGYQVTYHEHDRTMAPNIIAEKPGASIPDEIVIICGHYDSISLQPYVLAPGADDNGTGTAATLTAARVLADEHFERTIRFIAFSGEEQGLRGSQAYAQQAAAIGENIIGVINLDMIGYVDSAPGDLEVIGNAISTSLVDLFIECGETYTSLETNRLINGNITASDHSPFWVQGYPAMLGIEDYPVQYPDYHSINDTVDKVTPAFMTESTRAAVATIAHLAEPMMEVVYAFSALTDDSSGDGDGYMDPNETVDIFVDILNNTGQDSGTIQMNLICLTGNQYVLVQDNSSTLPSIGPGQQASNTDDPFRILIQPEVPEFTQLTCIVTLDCEAPHSSGYIFHRTITSYDFRDNILLFDMESDPGWTASDGNWQWGIPSGQGGGDHGNPDPASGFTGQYVLGNNLNGDYLANIESSVTSPFLDLTDVRQAELRFERWLNVETPNYDQAEIWIINSETSQRVWLNPTEITDNAWQTMSLDISDYADGRNDVRIRFVLRSDGGWEYSGWNVDDVRIAGLAPGDPLPTPTPQIPDDSIGVDLGMADVVLEPGDPFSLSMQIWNTTGADRSNVALFVILDIGNQYWFWPEWTSSVGFQARCLPADTIGEPENLLAFTWPELTGPSGVLRFWSALTIPDLTQLLGEYDMIEWEYR